MNPNRLILVSRSPRRREILEKFGYDFDMIDPAPEEDRVRYPEDTIHVARSKIPEVHEPGVYLSADTVVFLEGEPLGKPRSKEQAAEYLRRLSGRVHEVVTGYTVLKFPEGELRQGLEITEVRFSALGPEEIEWLLAQDHPWDKAGAYGIQGFAGLFVPWIRGSYLNVVGLPIERLYPILKRWGIVPRTFPKSSTR